MPGLPKELTRLAERALRTRGSGVETARLLDVLAVSGGDVALIREHYPQVEERELRAAFHALADLARAIGELAPEDVAAQDAAAEDAANESGAANPAASATNQSPSALHAPRSTPHDPRLLWALPGPKRARVHIDGCSKGNPGPAAIGAQFLDWQFALLGEYGEAIGSTTNNVAEYVALRTALQLALAHGVERLQVYTDSQLLERQVRGVYRVKHPGLKPLHAGVLALVSELKEFKIAYVPREDNRRADELANRALGYR